MKGKIENGRIAITLTPKGIDTVAFTSADKKEALAFYIAISDELENFGRQIQNIAEKGDADDK